MSRPAQRSGTGTSPAEATPPDVVRVLYIGGLGRSGSTLLQLLLERCPGTVSVGELTHLWQRGLLDRNLCGCGRAVPECPFWAAVVARALGRVSPAEARQLQRRTDRTRYLPWLAGRWRPPSFQRDLDRYASILAPLYRAIAEVAGGRIVIDSSKQPCSAAVLRHVPGVDLRVVHLVRDPRAVAHSWMRERLRPEVTGHRTLMPRWPARSTARRWVSANAQMELLAATGTPSLRLTYEELAARPIDALRRVCDHVGLEPPADLLAELETGTFEPAHRHSVSGNPIRFSTGVMHVREDDSWEQQLPPRAKAVVAAIAAPIALRYGYRWQWTRRSRRPRARVDAS